MAIAIHTDLLAGREEHVHLAGRWALVEFLGQDDQLVRRVPSGRDDDENLLSLFMRGDRAAGRSQDLVRIGDARPAELLHQKGHFVALTYVSGGVAMVK
jgi:hypothetical protein